jgi:hypothetical protein
MRSRIVLVVSSLIDMLDGEGQSLDVAVIAEYFAKLIECGLSGASNTWMVCSAGTCSCNAELQYWSR